MLMLGGLIGAGKRERDAKYLSRYLGDKKIRELRENEVRKIKNYYIRIGSAEFFAEVVPVYSLAPLLVGRD